MSSQKTPSSQKGKGLVGFLAGLVLATMIIIAVLLMLNGNSKRDFKNDPTLGGSTPAQADASALAPPLQQDGLQTAVSQPAPEHGTADAPALAAASETRPAVTPAQTAAAAGAAAGAAATANALQNKDKPTAPAETKPAPKAQTAPAETKPAPKAQTAPAVRDSRPAPQAAVKPRRPESTVRGTSVFRPNEQPVRRAQPAPSRPAPERNVAVNRPKPAPKLAEAPKPKPAATAKAPAKDPKPTPQMILETGNIDKAREAAKRQAAGKPAPAKPVAKTESKPAASGSKGGNVVLQAGSFSSARAADAQRARLAMMGVQTKISEAKVDGKSVYRVHTAPMNSERAGNTKNRLNKNGVNDVYERSAQQ
nr:SPOR domain-containing protein [Conchiformibius kuhniae]